MTSYAAAGYVPFPRAFDVSTGAGPVTVWSGTMYHASKRGVEIIIIDAT